MNTRLLTLENILSHTPGLVPHAYDNLVEAHLPMHTIIESSQRVNISGIPGRCYGYQNLVFSLHDALASISTGEPIGMNDATAGFAAFMPSHVIGKK